MDTGLTIAGNEIWQIIILFGFIVLGLRAGKLLKCLLNQRASEIYETRVLTAAHTRIGPKHTVPSIQRGLVSRASFLSVGVYQHDCSDHHDAGSCMTAHCPVNILKLWMIKPSS